MNPLTPSSLPELIEAVRATPRLLAIGAGTKPRLSAVDAVKLSTVKLSGILEYEPSEFTFTALAGTPLREIAAELAQRGQYLPFDPPFVDAGATLGGTVASGLSGPGRFRFGGLRDFILGVRFVDGAGRCLRMGGKVVKNAAGFDLPKFFVGSLGRFGVLAELTFKVFPAPPAPLTLKLPVKDMDAATRILTEAANSRWEPDALDLLPGGSHICLRLAGPSAALSEISREILARWPGETLSAESSTAIWSELREFQWAHADGPLLKIPLTPATLTPLFQKIRSLTGLRAHISAGGNVAYLSLPSNNEIAALSQQLTELNLSALVLRGEIPLWSGLRISSKLAQSIKTAFDPENRFPPLEEP